MELVIIRDDKQEIKYTTNNYGKVVLECTQDAFEELVKAVGVLNKRRAYHREYKRKQINVLKPQKGMSEITFTRTL